MTPEQTVYAYVDAINHRDLNAIAALLPLNHTFIDAYYNKTVGREAIMRGWMGYYAWFPDYSIEVEDILTKGNTVLVFGFASGSYQGQKSTDSSTYWRLPSAWKAVIEGDKIKLWQVVCDSKIPYESMGEHGRLSPL